MKTKITILFAAFLICFTTTAQTKVGTIDTEYIISLMPQLKSVELRLKIYGSKLDSINQKKLKEYDLKVKTYNKEKKTLTDIQKKAKLSDIAALNKDITQFRQNGNQLMQLRRDEFMKPLYQKLKSIIGIIVKENGYTQILTTTGNDFAYIDSKFDITELALTKLGL